MKAYIMRGLPGSGKTTWLSDQKEDLFVYSADQYFYRDGVYLFDQLKLPEAHDRCLKGFIDECQGGADVAVDNTNIRLYEIAPYYRIAEAYGYEVQVIWIHADIEDCIKRNKHYVPEDRIRAMALSFEPLPIWWRVRHVQNFVVNNSVK